MFEYDESARKAAEILDKYDLRDLLREAYNDDIKDPWDIKVRYIPCHYPELKNVMSDLCEDEFMEYLSSRYPVKFDEVISYRMWFYNPYKEEKIMISCDCYKNGRCLGTKEVDLCNCEGDKLKCDFYDNVRKQGKAAEKVNESNRIKNAIANYYLDHMNEDERCSWCQNANGKTDLDFSIIDDNFGQYVHYKMIKFCPFCGRSLQNE